MELINIDIAGHNGFSIEIIKAEADVCGVLDINFILHHKTESLYGWGNFRHRWELQFELEELVDDSDNVHESEKFFSFTESVGVHPFPVAEAIIHKLNRIEFVVPPLKKIGTRIITCYRHCDQIIHIPVSSVSQLVSVLEQS